MDQKYVDDNRPFYRKAKDIADKIESKRKEMQEGRRASGMGTFAGLEKLIANRKQEASRAK